MRKESTLENVDQMKVTLAGGALVAATARQGLVSGLLGGAGWLLGIENVAENIANFGLQFLSEELILNNVCYTCCL